MGPRHYNRPPNIITSLESRHALQRIDEVDAPGSNALGVNRDFIDATMEIVNETPISAQGEDAIEFIHTRLVINGKNQFLFTAIYASPMEDNRHDMWDKIRNIAVAVQEPWLLAGDFNDIMSQDEKQGGALVNFRRCRLFQERVNDCKLLDLGAVGSKFTWRGPIYEDGVHIFERLDRALCNDGWRVQFPNAIVRTLPRVDFSDHHPLLVLLDDMISINNERPFRFESAWQTHDSFQTDLSSWWRQELNFTDNLSKVEDALKEWRINMFGSVKKKRKGRC
ncbi:unnamed protein product [Trifolium pratense]|uniref:Uncharacterized protein n=1 Tax=Trifolium pratense TaxID=57577 RepID=A0ACB0JNX1_TRIPR|nr:unnamed protein product [Trifolium pratense]